MESMGEESLLGTEVNFVFRMEKLAGSLGIGCLLSKTVREKLGEQVKANGVGYHEVKGFEGQYEFARCDEIA
jgi:class 3 adenylate cyclase